MYCVVIQAYRVTSYLRKPYILWCNCYHWCQDLRRASLERHMVLHRRGGWRKPRLASFHPSPWGVSVVSISISICKKKYLVNGHSRWGAFHFFGFKRSGFVRCWSSMLNSTVVQMRENPYYSIFTVVQWIILRDKYRQELLVTSSKNFWNFLWKNCLLKSLEQFQEKHG